MEATDTRRLTGGGPSAGPSAPHVGPGAAGAAGAIGSSGGVGAGSAAWSRFIGSSTRADELAGWLGVLCEQVPQTRSALLLLATEEAASFAPAAVWPDADVALEALADAARQALTERRGVVRRSAAAVCVAYPVESGAALLGAVVLALPEAAAPALQQQALRAMHWASAWLLESARGGRQAAAEAALARTQLANRLVAVALQHSPLLAACTALANELAASYGCEQVAIGFDEGAGCRVLALSHRSHFEPGSPAARVLAAAMDESLDLGRGLHHPPAGTADDSALLCPAHRAWAEAHAASQVWTVPLLHQGEAIGVLAFERRAGAPAAAAAPEPTAIEPVRDTSAVLGELLGPLLALQRANERSAWARLRDGARATRQALFGAGSPGLKLLTGVAVVALLALVLVPGEHRVSARTVVEGAVQRAAVAPFDGFIAESRVRAGDSVRAGAVLARMDDRPLQIERARWLAEAEQANQRLRQAQAQGDRAAMNQMRAQADQAQAQLGLVDERLERAVLRAPFDGVVVSGDLRQLVGTPIQQGKPLFEVAPLSDWRVTLQVDERDVAFVQPGQRGRLRLTGRPGEDLPFTVAQVTPVAVAEDGRNFFRVEAKMDASAPALSHLRPGLEGVAKVAVGERPLGWIWFRPLADWLRLQLWSWLP